MSSESIFDAVQVQYGAVARSNPGRHDQRFVSAHPYDALESVHGEIFLVEIEERNLLALRQIPDRHFTIAVRRCEILGIC